MSLIYILDDHSIYAKGLKFLLLNHDKSLSIKIFTKSNHLWEFLEQENPDLLIIDQILKERSGIELLIKAKQTLPTIKSILISSSKDLGLLNLCKENSIEGYIYKSESEKMIVSAIEKILQGETFYSEKDLTNPKVKKSNFPMNPFFSFTSKELEVLKYLASGLTHKEIAEKMNVSSRTIDAHRNNIAQKMNKLPTIKIVYEAFLWGILKEEDLS